MLSASQRRAVGRSSTARRFAAALLSYGGAIYPQLSSPSHRHFGTFASAPPEVAERRGRGGQSSGGASAPPSLRNQTSPGVMSSLCTVVVPQRLREALHHVGPHRFPVVATTEAELYDIRQLVYDFRDELSGAGGGGSATAVDGGEKRLLSSVFCFEQQYPLPATTLPHGAASTSPVASNSAGNSASGTSSRDGTPAPQPHASRFSAHTPSGTSATVEHSTGNRMTAIVVRSKATKNAFAIFGSGTVVGFGSGDPRDVVFRQLLSSGGSVAASSTTSSNQTPAGSIKQHAEDEYFDDDIADATGEEEDDELMDDALIAEADELILFHRARLISAEVAELKQLLSPYQLVPDPLLALPKSECPVVNLVFTTMDELYRGSDGAAAPLTTVHPSSLLHFSSSMFGGGSTSDGWSSDWPPLNVPHPPPQQQQQHIIPSYADNRFLVLAAPTAGHLLPFAFCLAEWLHLKTLERLLVPIVRQAASWKLRMLEVGKPKVPLQTARKAKAQVLRISSRHGKLGLTRHRLFWESPMAVSRGVFHHACAHFEVFTLHDNLREQLDSLAKTLSYICDEAHADTNHRLEWIIIALITFELWNAARHAYDHQMEKRCAGAAAAAAGQHGTLLS